MSVAVKRRRFTVDEYDQMGRAGILGEDDRVELLEGEIIEMSPIGDRHQACVDRSGELFVLTFGSLAQVRVQGPLRIEAHSEPQPDIMLLRRRDDYYASGHPQPRDVLLLLEVADTSLEVDRRVKVPLYARSGVREVWLVDLERGTVTLFRDQQEGSYRSMRVARPGEKIAPAAFPDREVAVSDLLP